MIRKLMNVIGGFPLGSFFKVGGVFTVECYGPDGKLRWKDTAKNLIPDVGINHILDVVFHGNTQVTTWYIGLKNAGTVAAADTLASHAGWAENSNYTGDRKEFNEAAASAKSITNSANKASFSINADAQTIAGAFLSSVSTGTSGVLGSAADFDGGNKSCDDGDTLEVTYTVTGSST